MQPEHKVVHVITRLDKGGSAENTLLTVLGLDEKKFDVILIKGSRAVGLETLVDALRPASA